MEKKKCKIKSSESVDIIVSRLKSITIEKQPFFKPKGILFLGKIKGDSFRLITFNAPPMKFDFKIRDTEIEFEYQKDSLSKTFKGLVYVLTIPIFGGLWIWGLIDKNVDLSFKLILTLLLLLPFLINKLISFLYERVILADDDKFLKKLEKSMEIKIE